MSTSATTTATTSDATLLPLLRVVSVVFLGAFSIGIPFASLPSHVREDLGFGNLWVGLILGSQSLVTLLTRHFAGTRADLLGPKPAVVQGLALSVVSGLLSLLSLSQGPVASLALLLVARVTLGLGESLLITGALAWGVGLLGPARAGRVMAWSGMAMYGAVAASAPLSLFIGHRYGFAAVVLGTIIAPLLAGLITWLAPGTPPAGKERMAFYKVLHRVWRAGVGLSLSAVGFAGLAGFAVLHFKEKGWIGASLVMTTFGGAFILARVFFADAPDRYGGKRVGVLSAIIEAAGQLLFWLAPGPLVALAGAALTGFGYSLVFPSLGVEAVRKIEPQFKGVALGAYVAFFDLALGVTGPVAGLVANQFGYSAVYLFGLLACALAALVASRL